MNKKMWNLYKDSENGKKVVELFNPEVEDVYKGIEGLFDYAKKWGSMINPEHVCIWYMQLLCNLKDNDILTKEAITKENFMAFAKEFEVIEARIDKDEKIVFYDDAKSVWIKRDNYRAKAALVHLLSTFLYYNVEVFKPVILPNHFDAIQRNCDALGLELPPIPYSKDYLTYLGYYYAK